MELKKLPEFLKKNRVAALVLLLGLVLMLLPTGKGQSEPSAPPEEPLPPQESLENRLEGILQEVAGVGTVRVLLTQASGETRVYQLDEQELTDGDRRENRRETVTLTQSDRQQDGLVTKVVSPEYRGAVVVCQGGDNPAVRLSVVEAVSGATGLPSNRITVLKMK